MIPPILIRSTPHQLVYEVASGNVAALDILYIALVLDAVDGPLKAALVAAQGQTAAQADAIACLITGSLALPALSSGFSDIQVSFLPTTAAFNFETAVTADVDAGNSPKIVVSQNAANSNGGYLYITHRWSPTV